MSLPSFMGNRVDEVPFYFHRVREGETLEDIAVKYDVNLSKIDLTVTPLPGEIVVIDLQKALISLS